MENELTLIAGIDLGTTYSCIAVVDEFGRPNVLKNFEGKNTTPSVIYFEDDESIIVGEEAKNNLKVSPDKTVDMVKRSMGDPNYMFPHNGQDLSAEELSSYILRKLVKDGSNSLGQEIKDVVITCPAYFGINEREATKKAGELAGLTVRDVINEPTAAAIAYGMEQQEDKTILVYDLGGGTFDVTIISLTKEKIEVIVTGGDHHLGGRDWDQTIVKYLADRFGEENDSEENLLDDAETLNALYQSAERAKQTLTTRGKTTVVVQHEGQKAKIDLTREKLEELTEGLLERTITLTNDMLNEAREKGVTNFDELILVGGSSKMPMVAERLKKEFSQEPKLHDPDEAIANGAALYAYKLSINDELIRRVVEVTGSSSEEIDLKDVPEEQMKEVIVDLALSSGNKPKDIEDISNLKIVNVISKSFGVVAIEGESNKEKLFNLILKNEALPAKNTQRFGTLEADQDSVFLQIMSSEVKDHMMEIKDGLDISEAILALPKGLPKNAPIDVTYKIDTDGTLHIEAIEQSEGRKVEISIQTNSVISQEQFEEAKERSQRMVVS